MSDCAILWCVKRTLPLRFLALVGASLAGEKILTKPLKVECSIKARMICCEFPIFVIALLPNRQHGWLLQGESFGGAIVFIAPGYLANGLYVRLGLP